MRMLTKGHAAMAAALVVAAWPINAASARPNQPTIDQPSYWATITHPGNEPNRYLSPGEGEQAKGRVDHEYRISKNEMVTSEWFRFVQAYKPFIAPSARLSAQFFGNSIRWTFLPGGEVDYEIVPGSENFPASMGWRYAARYCNWLHNGRVNEAWAFESGVYDTSTFTDNPDGTFNDQRTHSPGAKYWIPTEDEWYKAAYFDPHKNGNDQPGYWMYPTTSDTAPVGGPPGTGETNAGDGGVSAPIGSYPGTASPWGLLDLSGNYVEWVEDATVTNARPLPVGRNVRGTFAGWGNSAAFWDSSVARGRSQFIGDYGSTTFRIASAVPGPGVWFGVMVQVLSLSARRDHRGATSS